MAGRQEVQAQELGEEVGIRDVVGVFHPAVGLHRRGVGEHDVIALILQTVHQPIPVERRLQSNGGNALLMGVEESQNQLQITGQLLMPQTASCFIHEPAERVVAVQVNSSHDLHSGSPVG